MPGRGARVLSGGLHITTLPEGSSFVVCRLSVRPECLFSVLEGPGFHVISAYVGERVAGRPRHRQPAPVQPDAHVH